MALLHTKKCPRCKATYWEPGQFSICPHAYKKVVDKQHDQAINGLFHKLWRRDVDNYMYDKGDWLELQLLLQARGIDI